MPLPDVEVHNAGRGRDDIDDGIDRADLMKVDLVDRDVVDLRLGGAKQLKSANSKRLDRGAQGSGLDQPTNDSKRAAMAMLMLVALLLVRMRMAGLVQVLRLDLRRHQFRALLVRGMGCLGRGSILEHSNLGGRDPRAIDDLSFERGVEMKRSYGLVKHLLRNPGIDQGSEKHVAGDAGEAIKIRDTHAEYCGTRRLRLSAERCRCSFMTNKVQFSEGRLSFVTRRIGIGAIAGFSITPSCVSKASASVEPLLPSNASMSGGRLTSGMCPVQGNGKLQLKIVCARETRAVDYLSVQVERASICIE